MANVERHHSEGHDLLCFDNLEPSHRPRPSSPSRARHLAPIWGLIIES